jgi:hypothetical protein
MQSICYDGGRGRRSSVAISVTAIGARNRAVCGPEGGSAPALKAPAADGRPVAILQRSGRGMGFPVPLTDGATPFGPLPATGSPAPGRGRERSGARVWRRHRPRAAKAGPCRASSCRIRRRRERPPPPTFPWPLNAMGAKSCYPRALMLKGGLEEAPRTRPVSSPISERARRDLGALKRVWAARHAPHRSSGGPGRVGVLARSLTGGGKRFLWAWPALTSCSHAAQRAGDRVVSTFL